MKPIYVGCDLNHAYVPISTLKAGELNVADHADLRGLAVYVFLSVQYQGREGLGTISYSG